MAFQDKDLAEKLLLVAQFKNRALEFARLADACENDIALITARGWGEMSDEELGDLAITSARLLAYVAFIVEFTKLMSNQAVTTTAGRVAVDGIRNL
jgi:hypothetical protein